MCISCEEEEGAGKMKNTERETHEGKKEKKLKLNSCLRKVSGFT
jgi:hypothetical protein